jgi:adenylate cyclase
MNYTAIGDAINLASRLEGLNKLYGTSIIASGTIVARAKEAFDFRLLDVVAVKGKSDPITIYELLGTKGALEHCRQVVSTYESAFSAYCSRKIRECARCPAGERERPSEHRVDRTVQGFFASAASRGLARNLHIGVEGDRGAHALPAA